MAHSYKKAAKPEDIPALFAEAWNHRDAGKIASLFEEDAEFVNVVGLWWHSRKDIQKAHAYGLEKIFNSSDLKIRDSSVKYLSEDIAVVHARMRLADQTAKGDIKNPSIRQSIFSFVVHRKKEEWRCVSAQNTDIVPGAETNIISEEGEFKSVNYRKG